MSAGETLITECPSCGRRYLPPRELCSACLLTHTRAAAPRATARVLSYSILQRAGSSAVIKPPITIALVREEDDGASFTAPVEGDAAGLAIGETVDVRKRSWTVENGESFTGIVVKRRNP